MFNRNEKTDLKKARDLVLKRLLENRSFNVKFTGKLSDSAVATAVACLAMSLEKQDRQRLEKGISWLCRTINNDGGWGDTPESPTNLSAVLLARAAVINSDIETDETRKALQMSSAWLEAKFGSIEHTALINRILAFYGKDLTFSVPILTVCMLGKALGSDQTLWKKIPSLPFEFSLMPAEFLNLVRLPVVSYAIPALIAVGIAQSTRFSSPNPLARWLRNHATRPALRKLTKLIPESGGFLEAIPLTGFVAFCLGRSGHENHPAVKRGLPFLRSNMRDNGSWPIDTNLSNWLTSLSSAVLCEAEMLSSEEKRTSTAYIKNVQSKKVNSFNNSAPGGWSWTDLSGGVPDADDTSAALVALAKLSDEKADKCVTNGLNWLLDLMNADGGIPTFCRGWGFLPFDRSCPDISAHCLAAFVLWRSRVSGNLKHRIEHGIQRILKYLRTARDSENLFTPLWFGDQDHPAQTNRVCGTSVVLESLSYLNSEEAADLIGPAVKRLYLFQNPDGGFGGDKDTRSKIETTARAINALLLNKENTPALKKGINYLIQQVFETSGNLPAQPTGLYFSSLWYDEKLYPLIFSARALTSACRIFEADKYDES